MRINKTQATAIAVLCSFSAGAHAQQDSNVHPFISSTYGIHAGVFFPSKDFRLSVNGSVVGTDQDFDFEKATGASKDDEIFAIEFKWRFGEKWSVELQHFTADQSTKAVLEEDITWRDQAILAGSSVIVGTNFYMTRAFFGRSFDWRDNVDAGIGLGVHWLEIGAFIEPDIMTTFGDVSAAKVAGPLPNIGAWYQYSPSPKWVIAGRVDWLEANVGIYKGGILNVAAGVNYQMFKRVGFGVKYELLRLDLDIDDDKWQGSTQLDYDGAFVYLSASW